MLFDINYSNVNYYTNYYVNYMQFAMIALKMKGKSILPISNMLEDNVC